MASTSRGKDLEEAYANLSLNGDDEDGLILEDIPGNNTEVGLERCLVGCFVTNRKVNFMAMQDTLSSIWRPVKGVFMEETDQTNMFLFKFFHDRDMQRVLEDGPWTFNQQVLLLKKLNVDEQLKDIKLSELYMWVQVYDVPVGFKSEFVLKSIGNFIGKFMESDPRNFQGMFKNYLRIRVAIDIHRPLKSQMRIKKPGGEWLWVKFKYERLPSFCFYCGRIGHTEKFCEDSFDNHQGQEVRKYDGTLRAPLRNQGPIKSNQWLRGSEGEVLTPVKLHEEGKHEGRMEQHREGRSGNFARDERDPRKSGESELTSKNSGENPLQVIDPKDLEFLNDRREKDFTGVQTSGPISDGLALTIPKRRRVEEPKENGPGEENNTVTDADMTEEDNTCSLDPKNLSMAGTAMQSRPSL